MRRAERLLIATALAAVAGCKGVTVYEPVPVTTELLVYVPVPEQLTAPLEIESGALRDCPRVARARRQALEQCNADKEAIARIQGTIASEAGEGKE